MAIMTLELWYIFKDYIIKSAYLQCASVVKKVLFYEIFLNLICCSTLCELLIYKVSRKFNEENVKISNIYLDAVTEFRIDKIAIHACVATQV